MSITEVKQLPLQEKFQLLEALWEDLADNLSDIPLSPEEQTLLDSRLANIDTGATTIHRWDEVKNLIGK